MINCTVLNNVSAYFDYLVNTINKPNEAYLTMLMSYETINEHSECSFEHFVKTINEHYEWSNDQPVNSATERNANWTSPVKNAYSTTVKSANEHIINAYLTSLLILLMNLMNAK